MPSLHTEIFVTLIHHCPQVPRAVLEYKEVFGPCAKKRLGFASPDREGPSDDDQPLVESADGEGEVPEREDGNDRHPLHLLDRRS